MNSVALCGNDVADIPALEGLVEPLGQTVALQEQLYTPRHVLELCKTGLAHHALGHQAAGDLDPDRFRLEEIVVLFTVLCVQLAGHCIAAEIVRKGVTRLP